VFLPLVLPRQVIFLARATTSRHRIKGRLTAMFFKLADQLPIDRSGGGPASGVAHRLG